MRKEDETKNPGLERARQGQTMGDMLGICCAITGFRIDNFPLDASFNPDISSLESLLDQAAAVQIQDRLAKNGTTTYEVKRLLTAEEVRIRRVVTTQDLGGMYIDAALEADEERDLQREVLDLVESLTAQT